MGSDDRVVVGVGSVDSTYPAIEWAAREARARRATLHLVRAYHPSGAIVPWETAAEAQLAADFRRLAGTALDDAVAHVSENWPELPVTSELVDGIPWDVMVDQSKDAELTVLGSRHLGAVGAVVLGSVSTVVAARASGPVVVVEGPPGLTGEDTGVVVGLDGSDTNEDVLAFAFDYADRHACPLHAVLCWHPDVAAAMQWRPEPPAPASAERWLADQLAIWRGKYPAVAVQAGVVRDHPVSGLVAAAAGQDLLVVGARAKHARLAPLLGSVSQGVLHHATCPVAVVHHRQPH